MAGRRYGVQIRAAAAADAAGIAELFASCGRSLDPVSLAARIEARRRGAGVLLIAEEWGPPSGLAALDWTWTLDAEAAVATLSTLLVAPESRRRGIARMLLKAGAQAARAAGCGTLRVSAPDGAADLTAFCGASGFEAEGALLSRPLRKGHDREGSG